MTSLGRGDNFPNMQPLTPPSPAPRTPDPQDHILVAVDESAGYAKINGRGSYKVSSSMKSFAGRVIDLGKGRLVIDLHDCIGMDSTFMGVLAGVSQRLSRECEGKVVVTGVSDKITNLMKTLGLSRLVEIHHDGSDESGQEYAALDNPGETPLESAETMLEAHENLVDIHEENSLRFQDVLDYLRDDIQRHRG